MADSVALPTEWQHLVAVANGRTLLGQPGVRDPEAPCDQYEPQYATKMGVGTVWVRPRPENEVGQCDTDGHYLCVECPHISHQSLVERGFFKESP